MSQRLTRSEVEAMAESPIQANGAKYARALLAAWDALEPFTRMPTGGRFARRDMAIEVGVTVTEIERARAALPAPEVKPDE